MNLVKIILKEETFYALGFLDLANKRTISWQKNTLFKKDVK